MSATSDFKVFIDNLRIDTTVSISYRYGEITRALNKEYRETDSDTANSLQVGSYGRSTAIKGISDLDMIYMMPLSSWSRFNTSGGQYVLLKEVKEAIGKRYSTTSARVDGQVVVVKFKNPAQKVEVVPAFEQVDKSFKYPDTTGGGNWKITKPRAEIKAISDKDASSTGNLRNLCKMVRAWKNKHGVAMNGLLIDTLAYNFLEKNDVYCSGGYACYQEMVRDFFKHLSELKDQDYFKAPGSGQYVYVKKKFTSKAKKAYNLCIDAIAADGTASYNKKWRNVFGGKFPTCAKKVACESASRLFQWNDTEEFVEDKYPVDIKYDLEIDCEVTQDGYRTHALLEMINMRIPLLPQKRLLFKIMRTDVPQPYEIAWKVLNRGDVAKKKNMIRGQIVLGKSTKTENTSFRGNHIVECYIIKDDVVVARDLIDVPIQSGA